ncbi:MAG TPA: ScyD/ScyE family protein [Candidatus Limnocylindrales bacterium]|nr:ScyD/ScyE family protein [Candidatus Limnocylindrales bacterium]
MSRVIHRPRSRPRGRTFLAVLGLAVALLAVPAAAAAAKAAAAPFGALFGLSTSTDGSLLVADASQGIVAIRGGQRTLFASLPGVTDVAAVGNGNVFAITGGGPPGTGAASLYRVSQGRAQLVADLGAFEAAVNPDPAEVDSNPFGLTVLNGGGVLVADAGGNSVIYADVTGAIDWIATLPTELGSTANLKALFGCPAGPPDFCLMPDMIPTEAVATDVVIGPDGAAYVSELKGFPAPAGESRVWRIAPGSRHVECGTSDACQVVADGFTSIVDLNFGPDGTLYVTELDEGSWAAVEILGTGAGGTINACEWGSFPLDCQAIATDLPIPMSTTIDKDGTLWTTILSLVPGEANVIAID